MIKKLSTLSLSFLLAVSLTACGGGETSAPANNNETNGSSEAPAASGDAGKELVVVDWGGAYTDAHKKASFEPFEKKYGVKITVVSPTDYGKFKAMVETGSVEWDVVSVDTDFAIRAGREGMLEKLDYNVIHKDGIPDNLVFDYGIASSLFSTVIGYNTKAFSTDNHPKSWAEFWDTKTYPGARSFYKSPTWTLEAALLADGVKPEELYPLDVDRAFKSLDKIKGDVKVWWNAGAQPPQLLATGEVPLSAAWNGRITDAKTQGGPVDLEYNQGLVAANVWVIPKGSKNKDLAMKFIDFDIAPEQQVAFSTNIDYAPANQKAIDLLPQDAKDRLGQSPENLKKQIYIDAAWWVDNFDSVNERFQQWLLKK